ncbi:serine hydrolase domain-containing protein [uncultured Winogradskyella sp.]|uniref:serine hydrolase domain-containing protein n=1 Tax=uncultured Winogradskyella sp. TaxID=395353 RepID=UPI0026103B16|nr:serine hydrolase domain-containing protein [uncultured Winogradskyella sp.]
MKPMRLTYIILSLILTFSCSSDDSSIDEPPIDEMLYFPPNDSDVWETKSISNLDWNENALQPLLDFLEDSDTKSFIILHNGRIVNESYFNGTTMLSNNPWFSAGKTLTAFTLGIAQEDGLLNITDSSSNYLGSGWSSLTSEQENAITVKNHITMTTGLDYTDDLYCTDMDCLTYLDDPNSFWYYHNAPYTLTQSIISGALNSDFDTYFNSELKNKIGMQGGWVQFGYNRFYASNARSMARFGLLCLNEGIWEDDIILGDANYFTEMTNTSQNLNPAYGYLCWLNGKSSYILPSSENSFTGKLIPNAPDDLIAGLGANDQKLYVIPSKKLVIIRMGNDGGDNGQLSLSDYDNLLWEKINDLIN